MGLDSESRIVMTLDAGGTNLRFSAMRGGNSVAEAVSLPSDGNDLTQCLANIVDGFTQVKALCPEAPSAISFAFPGPAGYPNGIIGDLGNLAGFRVGVALGPMLEEKFNIPVFINNDGDLFADGEAIAGLLPYVNSLLEGAGSLKRYKSGSPQVWDQETTTPYHYSTLFTEAGIRTEFTTAERAGDYRFTFAAGKATLHLENRMPPSSSTTARPSALPRRTIQGRANTSSRSNSTERTLTGCGSFIRI